MNNQKKNNIKKIITGTVLAAGQLILGNNVHAQEQQNNVFIPTKVATETSILANSNSAGIPFHRTEMGNEYWTFKYDVNFKLNPTDKPKNVGMLSLNKLYSKNNTSVGAELFQVGKFTKEDVWFIDAFVNSKLGKTSVMLDYGKGFQIDKQSKDYIIASAKTKRISLEGCVYSQGSILEKGVDIWKYGFISYKGDHIYTAIGNKVKSTYASNIVEGFKDFGNIAFYTQNRQTGDIWIKSQTAVGDVNKAIYSNEMGEIVSEYFGMPAYFPLHLSPLSTKGTADLKLEFKKTPLAGTSESEIMLGTNKTPFVQLGIGMNTEYKNHSAKSNVAIELYKEVKFGKFKGSAEFRYNNRSHEGTAYLKMSRTF